MCEFSGKLIAWLDHELADADAAAVERHLETCAACREQLAGYEDVSTAVMEYFERLPARVPSKPAAARGKLGWLAGIGIAAAAAVLLIVFLARNTAQPKPVTVVRTVLPKPAPRPETPTLAVSAVQHPRHKKRAEARTIPWTVPEQTVQIAIPADAIFPPGLFPEGVSFRAELSLGADGSPRGLYLRP